MTTHQHAPSPAPLPRLKADNTLPEPLLTFGSLSDRGRAFEHANRYIAMNRAAYRAIGEPRRVIVGVDVDTRTLTLRAARPHEIGGAFTAIQASHTMWRVNIGRALGGKVPVPHLWRVTGDVVDGALTVSLVVDEEEPS